MAFNKYQAKEIALGQEQGIATEKYALESLHHTMMHEVRKGLEKNIDLSPYLALPDLNFYKLRQLRSAIEKGFPVEQLTAKPYHAFQMKEIIRGWEQKIDHSAYAKPEIGYREMAAQRGQLLLEKEQRKPLYFAIDGTDSYRIYALDDQLRVEILGETSASRTGCNQQMAALLRTNAYSSRELHLYGTLSTLVEQGEQLTIKAQLDNHFPDVKTHQGYAILVENKTVALGYNPMAPDPMVLWQRQDSGYFWGKYGAVTEDFLRRAQGEGLDVDRARKILHSLTVAIERSPALEQAEEWGR